MRRTLSILAALAIFSLAGLLALYGLFAVVYRGDSGGSGDTYVTIVGHEFDADVIGVVSLVLAGVAIFFGIVFVRRGER